MIVIGNSDDSAHTREFPDVRNLALRAKLSRSAPITLRSPAKQFVKRDFDARPTHPSRVAIIAIAAESRTREKKPSIEGSDPRSTACHGLRRDSLCIDRRKAPLGADPTG